MEDSPKCPRCSLVGICLPEEIKLLRGKGKKIRRRYPSRDDSIPVYVVGYGHTVRKKGDRLEIRKEGKKVHDIPLRDVSQLSVYGNVHITIPVLRQLMQRGVPICYFSHGGWFYGFSQGITHKDIELRIQQYKVAGDPFASLILARRFVEGKIKNCRTMIRRNDPNPPTHILDHMARLVQDAKTATDTGTLLGLEGAAAQAYFSRFDNLLRTDDKISFGQRNKRPREDPVNAVLSYLYGVLTKECFVTLIGIGFDPYRGFYHQPKYGRPALALDIMEEFRPLIADSVTITLFNNGELRKKDFTTAGKGVTLKPEAKKKVLRGYERRLNTEIIHPIFGYTISYRRVLEVQARLLNRTLTKEINRYPPFCTR